MKGLNIFGKTTQTSQLSYQITANPTGCHRYLTIVSLSKITLFKSKQKILLTKKYHNMKEL